MDANKQRTTGRVATSIGITHRTLINWLENGVVESPPGRTNGARPVWSDDLVREASAVAKLIEAGATPKDARIVRQRVNRAGKSLADYQYVVRRGGSLHPIDMDSDPSEMIAADAIYKIGAGRLVEIMASMLVPLPSVEREQEARHLSDSGHEQQDP